MKEEVCYQQCGKCKHSVYSHDTVGRCSYCLMVYSRGAGVVPPSGWSPVSAVCLGIEEMCLLR